jgi:predicted nuclease with RNAse H fold
MTRSSVHTVGIDLAVQNAGTASCRIEWASAGPKIGTPLLGRSDDQLMEDVKGADIVGIDAPFGWPEPFFDAIRAHRAHGAWPGRGKGLEQFRQTLRLRCTDLVVKREALLTPLSVSADKIAVTTFRCALLLDRFEYERRWRIDRSGLTGRAVEVYPAAALKQWDLTQPKSYKAAGAYAERTAIARGLAKALDVTLPSAVEKACRETDHALDALVSAVVARAAALGWTRRPWSDDERERAIVEGWIHFPHPEAALRLVVGDRGPKGPEGWPPPRKKSRAKRAR